MGNSFAEDRKKRLEAGNKNQRSSYSTSTAKKEHDFREQRIKEYNSRRKLENRVDTDVWQTPNPLEEFARDYAARQARKKEEARQKEIKNQFTDYRKLGQIRLESQKKPQIKTATGTTGSVKKVDPWNQDSRKPSAYQELQKEGTWQQENRRLAEAKQTAWNEKRKAEQQAKVEQNRRNMTGIIEKGPFREGLERVVPYEELRNRPDFRDQVERGRNMEANPVAETAGGSMLGYFKDRVKDPYFAMKRRSHNLEELSQEEKNVYHYLYSRYGKDQADQYATSLDAQMNERKGRKMYESAAELRENNPVAGIAANIGRSAVAGVLSLGEGISRIPSMIAGNPVAEVPSAMDYYMGMMQENTESLPERSAYEAANSIGFLLPGALLGGALGSAAAGSSLFAAGVTGNAYNEAVMEGKDIDRARAYALASGASEEATQLLLGGVAGLSSGIGKRLFANSKIAAAAAKGLDGLIKNDKARKLVAGAGSLGADMVSEGTQEYTQELLDKAMRNMLFDEKNQIRLDDPEAWHAAFLGAVTAGAMNAPGMVMGAARDMRGNQTVLPEINEETVRPDDMQEESETPHTTDFTMQAEDSRVEQENTEYEPETEPEMAVEQQPLEELGTEETVHEESNILDETKVQFGPNGKTAYVDQYDNETWLPAYTRAFQRAYSAGRYNVDMDIAKRTATLAVIGNDQFMAAWKAGVQDRQLELNRQKPLVQRQARTGSMTDLSSESTSAQRTVAEHVGKMTGLQIELVDGIEAGAQASYGEGKIRISVNSDDFLGSTSHELTHFIKEYAPEQYRDYEDTAVKALMKAESTTFETLYEQYVNRYADAGQNLTHDEIVEEIVSDATQKFFNDADFIREVAAKNETVGKKILDFINDVIDAIQELIHKGKSRKAAAGLEENLVMYKRARRNWMQALEEAGIAYQSGMEVEKGAAENTAEKNRLDHPELVEDSELEKNYEHVRNMEPVIKLEGNEFIEESKNRNLRDAVAEYYGSFGNKIHNNVVGDIIIGRRSVKDDMAHGFGDLKAITFKAVPEVLEKGKVLRHSEKWKGRGYDSVAIGAKIKIDKGEYAGEYYQICIVRVNEQDNNMYLHEVYTTKIDGDIPFMTRPNQKKGFPGGDAPSIYSIFEKLGQVNNKERFQIKEPVEDSQGNKLTKEQRDYFKNSVVRDSEGRLMVLYHQTEGEFTVFDTMHEGAGSYDYETPYGIYLKPDIRDIGVKGNRQMALFANIENPIHALNRADLSKKLEASEAYRRIREEIGKANKEYSERYEAATKAVQDYIVKWRNENPDAESSSIYDDSGFNDVDEKEDIISEEWIETINGMSEQAKHIVTEFLIENGYDGIILEHDEGNWGRSTKAIIALQPEQVKNVDNLSPTDSKDIRFQLKEPVEETENLIAVHNMTAEKLLKTMQYAGIPMPSIAVTKADMGHSNFGEISLLFRKETIDPENRKNKVYSADAWTPTFPDIDYEANEKVIEQVKKRANLAYGKIPDMYVRKANLIASNLEDYLQREKGEDGIFEKIKDKTELKALYLAENGETVETVRKEVRQVKEKNAKYDDILKVLGDNLETIGHMPLKEVKEKYWGSISNVLRRHGATEKQIDNLNKSNLRFSAIVGNVLDYADQPEVLPAKTIIDEAAMEQDIESRVNQKQYEIWLKDLLKGLEKSTGIWNGKDYLTPSGNQRSFKQLHYEVTAENIVKAMLQGGSEKNDAGFHGVKTIRAEISDEFKSIDEIRAQSYRIRDTDTEEYANKLGELESRLTDVIRKIQSGKGLERNVFIDMDNIGNLILKAAKNPTAENIKQVMQKGDWWVSEVQAKEIASIIREVKGLPVNLFEAKPQRVVGFDEIAAAVIPEDADEHVVEALNEKGIRTVFYDQEKAASRKDAVNSVEGIRFQLEEVEDYTDAKDVNTLLKENEKLREANELLKKQFELTSKEEMRQSDIHKVSVNTLKKYGSRMKAEKLDRNITRLYEYIRSGEQVAWNEVAAVAADIGREILKQSTQVDTTMSEQYSDLRKQIQNTKIMISDQDKQDLMAVGGYNSFRKKYFGTLKLGKDGISVDSLYQELSDQHPELFDPEITHPAGQLEQIGAVMDLTKPQIINPYHADMDEMAYLVGQELLQEYYNVRQPAPTFADRREAELEKVKKQYKEKLEKYKDSTEKQYANLLKDARRETRDVRDEKETELLAQKIKYDRRLKERNENLRKREAKTRIIKEVNAMSKWLLNPTDKNHVPEELRGIVAEFLGSIDFSSKQDYNGIQTQRTQKWLEMKAAVDRIRDAGGTIQDEAGNIVYVDIDPDMAARIEEIAGRIKKVEKLEDLDAYATEEILKLVQSMKTVLRGINDLKRNQAYGKASLLAEEVFRETENMKNNRELKGAAGAGVKLMNVDMLDPQTMFEKMGSAMKSTYEGLRDGEDKQTKRIREAEIYFKDALRKTEITAEDIRKWNGDGTETTVFELSNGTIELSIPQVMSLYLMEKRGQARKHIYSKTGGIKAADRATKMSMENGKLKLAEIKKQYEPIKVNKEDVKKITDSLTADQKKLADAIQYFMGNIISEWGNETSMEMYGYKKFTAKDYFPIKTDQNYNSKAEGRQENSAIKNLGITKNTNQYANNPVIIEDVFDVFVRQVEQMSCYNAYVAPLSDLHKVMNYKDMRGYNGSSIKERLNAVFGKAGVQYIDKLVEDINGSVKADPSVSIMSRLVSNTKAASVAGNLRVAVQQPTALARAYAEMDAKYIAGGLMKPGADWDLILEYAPIAQWKDWGFYQMQVSRQLKDVLMGTDSAKQRFVNNAMVLAQTGDKIAWKRLWNAVELEVKDRKPNLKEGSQEFYQAVGQRFSEIVDRTQVVDSILHRPQIMRSKDGLVKQAVSFMSEPMKTYNMLYRAVWNVKATEKGSDARKQAYKKLEQAGAAYVASGFLTAVAASFIDAMRDDDREKSYGEKYKENFKENLMSNLILLNNVPYVKDVLSVFQGYTAKRMETQGIQDVCFAYKKVEKAIEGKGKYTPQFVFLEAIRSVSALTGIPIKSITRDALAIIDTISNGIGGEADYKWLKNTYDISHKENAGYYVKMMMQAEMEGDGKLSDLIKKDMIKAGFTEDYINDRVNSYLNDYMDEELGIDIPAAAMAIDPDVKGSKEEFQRQVELFVATKARVGWDEKKSLSTIKSKLTNHFKPLWKQAKTQKEKDAIIAQCNRLYYNGKNIYSGKDYEGWKK